MKFTLGIEEEYQIIDPVSRELISHDQKIVTEASKVLNDQVKAEMHQAVVEVGTNICQDITDAREQISNLRKGISAIANDLGFKIGAAGTHPFTKWETQLTTDNWHEILLKDDLHYGRSNPNHDPSGYRTEILAGLAEEKLQLPGFRKNLLSKDQKFIRPKGTELLPLLETGAIDFVIHYRSVLTQHKLGMLLLADSLNLSNPEHDTWYASVCTEVDGTSRLERITKCGEAMVYGICLPHNGNNPAGAKQFLQFVLTRGKEILEHNGQPSIKPVLSPKSIIEPNWYSTLTQ